MKQESFEEFFLGCKFDTKRKRNFNLFHTTPTLFVSHFWKLFVFAKLCGIYKSWMELPNSQVENWSYKKSSIQFFCAEETSRNNSKIIDITSHQHIASPYHFGSGTASGGLFGKRARINMQKFMPFCLLFNLFTEDYEKRILVKNDEGIFSVFFGCKLQLTHIFL